MNKPIILSAATALLVSAAIVFSAESASEARANLSPVEMTTIVSLAKTSRITIDEGEANAWDEASSEWTLDCYDQFGPEGWAPSENGLETCLSSAS